MATNNWTIFSPVPNAALVASGLRDIPKHWSLTPLQDKAPRRNNWQEESFIPHEQIAQFILHGEAKTSLKGNPYTSYSSGFGLRCGEPSGGLLAIDVDGSSAQPLLDAISGGDMPPTVSWTSGKPGRYQLLFQIPDEIREQVKDYNRAVLTEWEGLQTARDSEGKPTELLEFRYNRSQSCLPPSRHPTTGAYYWINSPVDTQVALAPPWLCELLIQFATNERHQSEEKQQLAAHQAEELLARRQQYQDARASTNLLDFLEFDVLPRLTAEQIYHWTGHNFRAYGKTLKGAPPWRASTSGTSFHVWWTGTHWAWQDKALSEGGGAVQYRWKLRGGTGTPHGQDFVEIVRELAADAGLELPKLPNPGEPDAQSYADYVATEQEAERVESALASVDLWSGNLAKRMIKGIAKRALRLENWLKNRRTTVIVPQIEIKIPYTPGQLPDIEIYKQLGLPKIIFQPGERLSLLQEATRKGYHNILDSSAAGTFKSSDAGMAAPGAFGVEKLFYFSAEHRNPTTRLIEENYQDMVVRNDGLSEDPNKLTPGGKPHTRWPKPGENPTNPGNCHRTPLFHALAAKGYELDGSAENPICQTCHLSGACGNTSGAGFGFRSQRAEAFKRDRIRLHPDSAPKPDDMEQPTGAFWDEALRIINPIKTIDVGRTEQTSTWAELEVKLPEVHAALKPLRLALYEILSDKNLPRYGLSDLELRQLLGEAPALESIITQLKNLSPKWDELLEDIDTVDAKANNLTKREAARIRQGLRASSYRNSATNLGELTTCWLVPFLEVWARLKPGALRMNRNALSVTTRNSRHQQISKAMAWNCYLDATASRQSLALALDIECASILHIEQEMPDFSNLEIVHIPDLGLLGRDRRDFQIQRLETLRVALTAKHPDIAFIDHKKFVQPGDGHWFHDNRGSNAYQDKSALAGIGTPIKNVGVSQSEFITLTGNADVGKESAAFASFVQNETRAELTQFVGRLRAHNRPNEKLTCYLISRGNIDFLQYKYPGATITTKLAREITPLAGTAHEQNLWKVCEAIDLLNAQGAKITQKAVSQLSTVAKSTISWLSSGNWEKMVKAAISTPFSSYETLIKAQDSSGKLELEVLSTDVLPKIFETPPTPDHPEPAPQTPSFVVEQLEELVEVYGAAIIYRAIALTTSKIQVKIIATLLQLLPEEAISEIREAVP